MSATNDGGPAFPTAGWQDGSNTPLGMSLRDWFAGQALAGLCACESVSASDGKLASAAYSIADAMLAARNSRNTTTT